MTDLCKIFEDAGYHGASELVHLFENGGEVMLIMLELVPGDESHDLQIGTYTQSPLQYFQAVASQIEEGKHDEMLMRQFDAACKRFVEREGTIFECQAEGFKKAAQEGRLRISRGDSLIQEIEQRLKHRPH